MSNDQVLIVGAGPIGLTLACLLLKKGVSVDIIDKRQQDTKLLRAIAVNMKTLNIFSELNIANDLIKVGKKVKSLTVSWKNRRLFQVKFSKQEFPYDYFLHIYQPQVEESLIHCLAKYHHCVKRGYELIGLQQTSDYVRAQIKDDSGKLYSKDYRYCIGCDGGQSKVREEADIQIKSELYGSHFMLADVYLEGDYLPQNTKWYVDENGYLMVVPGPGDRYRIIGSGLEKPKQEMCLQEYQQLLIDKQITQFRIKQLEWQAIAPFGHRIAETPQNERVFLAGDAYHQFSPIGGINMNIGIEDAAMLAFKLVRVIKEKKSEYVLNEYQVERQKMVSDILHESKQRTLAITNPMQYGTIGKQYLPKMQNRKFLKRLSFVFSGLDQYNKMGEMV